MTSNRKNSNDVNPGITVYPCMFEWMSVSLCELKNSIAIVFVPDPCIAQSDCNTSVTLQNTENCIVSTDNFFFIAETTVTSLQ